MTLDAEALLIERCRAGDREAYAALVRRYQRQVYALAYRLIGERGEAEDVAQETFLRCYRSLATFRVGQPFGPWIYRIATNVALDRLRRCGREAIPAGGGPPSELADRGPNPDEEALRREDERRLAAAVAALAPEYRVPVVLFHLQGLPLAEVARVTGLPLTVVKNRLYRARKMLRQALCDQDSEAAGRCRDEQVPVRAPVGSLR